jgi:hypothetical protein
MNHYYMNIQKKTGAIEDEDGLDLPDDQAARQEALAAARQILEEQALLGVPAEAQTLEVRDEDGKIIAKLAIDQVSGAASFQPTWPAGSGVGPQPSHDGDRNLDAAEDVGIGETAARSG